MNYKESQFDIVYDSDNEYVKVYNSYSGASSKIEKKWYAMLQNGHADDTPFLQEMIRQGHAVDEAIDEYAVYEVQRRREIYDSPKNLQFVIVPSMSCNCKCIYCFEDEPSRNRHSHQTVKMSSSVADNAVSFILRCVQSDPNVEHLGLTWFGGEPLLQLPTIEYISQKLLVECTQRNISFSAFVITNGLLLTQDVIDKLVQCHVTRIQITLDGTEKYYSIYKRTAPGNFKKILKIIKNVTSVIRVDLRLNISLENQESVYDLVSLLVEEGIVNQNLYIYPAQIVGIPHEHCTPLSDADFEFIRQKVEALLDGTDSVRKRTVPRKLMYCSTIKKDYAVIGPNGELYRCEHEVGNPSEIIGDVRSGFYRNSADMKYLEMQFDEKCKKCAFLPLCAGGCPTFRMLYAKKPDCDTVKKHFTELLKNK